MLLAQLGIAVGLVAMALADPTADAARFALLAVATAFAAATQDIAVDAYRIEARRHGMAGRDGRDLSDRLSARADRRGRRRADGGGGLGWTFAYLLMAACVRSAS